jgi:hypothetical protein
VGLEELIKFGPNQHRDLVKVEIEGTELSFPEGHFIFLVDGQHQQQSV